MAKGLIQNIDDTTFAASTAKGLVLVDFSATWCAPCRALEPILEQLSIDLEGKVSVIKIDVDAAPKVTTQFQITSVPTMIVLKDGQEVHRIVGLKDLETLKKLILQKA
jgi:thioredoxin 1